MAGVGNREMKERAVQHDGVIFAVLAADVDAAPLHFLHQAGIQYPAQKGWRQVGVAHALDDAAVAESEDFGGVFGAVPLPERMDALQAASQRSRHQVR